MEMVWPQLVFSHPPQLPIMAGIFKLQIPKIVVQVISRKKNPLKHAFSRNFFFFTLGGNGGSHLECVSCRVLNINLNPQKGIHYHLPILFDYFHLSAVSLTIHAALVSLHQPYIK